MEYKRIPPDMVVIKHQIVEWARKQFPNQTYLAKLNHLGDEVEELKIAINDCVHKNYLMDHDVQMELADCFILLVDTASLLGFSEEDIRRAMWEKLQINKKRKWGEPKENGVVNHVEDDEDIAYQDPFTGEQ